MVSWLLGNLTELLAILAGLGVTLLGLRWKWRGDGEAKAKQKFEEKDRERAQEIRDRLSRDRAQRVRELDDAGWRDGE